MPRKVLLLLAFALLASCRKPVPPSPPPPPSVAATLLVYETAVRHENRTFRWEVMTDGTRVRFGDEAERWRLFDTQAKTISFVDETNRSCRVQTFDQSIATRRSLLETPLPEGAPRARVSEQPAGTVEGRDAVRVSVEAGGYRRALVISVAPILPASAAAMKWMTDPLDPQYAGVVRDLMPVLLSKQGTLLSDRNELAYDGGSMVIETRLLSVRESRLPKSMLEVPPGYRREGSPTPASTSTATATRKPR